MDNLRRFILVFVGVVFLALSISGFVLADKFQDASSVTKKDIEVSCDKYDPDIEPFNDNILIVIGDKNNDSSELVMVANVNTVTSSLSFMYIPLDFMYTSDDRAGDLLNDKSMNEAADSLASFFNTTIDYYIHITSKDFVDIVNAVDFDGIGVEHTIPVDLVYKSGSYNINLKGGTKYLTGEDALQLIQFYKTKNNTYDPDLYNYYDGTDTKRIEASQKFLHHLIEQKFLNADENTFVQKFTEALNPIIDGMEDTVTNIDSTIIRKLALLFNKMNANSINYFMADGDYTVFDEGSWVYNNKVVNLISADHTDGKTVWEDKFSTD